MLYCTRAISRRRAETSGSIVVVLPALLFVVLYISVIGFPACAQPAQDAGAARLALLIANAKYPGTDPIVQLSRDVSALADELRRSGFETEVRQNQSKLTLQATFDAFKAKIKPGATVLIYLGGYGIQSGRQNYFIPIDAQIWTEGDVARDGISIESMLSVLNANGARIKLAVLDLSRRNPFERRFRSFSAGLGSVGIPLNTLIISAAGQNQLVRETPGDDTLFMRELLKEMRVPGVTADVVFNKTRLDVSLATNNEEVPWVSSSLTEEFYFLGQPAATGRAATGREEREAAKREGPKQEELKEERKREDANKDDSKRGEPANLAHSDSGRRGCADQVSLNEARGVVDFRITSPCRPGAAFSVNAGPLSLQTAFDKEGKARLQIPLLQESTDVTWTAGDGTTKTEPVRFAGARDAFRIALVWRQPVDLQLHVVEPGGSVNGEKGHVWRKQPNEDFKSGVGSLQIDADSAAGASRVELYDVPPARNPHNGLFKVYVDFAARGDVAAAPYCGTGEMAAPSFEIWVLRYGRRDNARRFGFRPEECGSPPKTRPSYFADVNASP